MESVGLIPVAVTAAVGVTSAVTDLWRFKVYNAVVFPFLLLGLLYHGLAPSGAGILFSLKGAGLGFALLIVLYVLGGVGAGDVKLLTGVGAWLGVEWTLVVFIFAAVATGVYTLFLMLRGGRTSSPFSQLYLIYLQALTVIKHLGSEERVEQVVKMDNRRRRLIPFAAMLALGMIAVICRQLWW